MRRNEGEREKREENEGLNNDFPSICLGIENLQKFGKFCTFIKLNKVGFGRIIRKSVISPLHV